MIGGNDITIQTSDSPAALELAVRTAFGMWSRAIVEDAVTGEMWPEVNLVPFTSLNELLIYKDEASANQWHELGADESLNGTMVHVLLGDDQITLVVDSTPTKEIETYVSSIQDSLRTTKSALTARH